MKYQFIRSEVILGTRAIKKLNDSRVLVAGPGGLAAGAPRPWRAAAWAALSWLMETW